MSHASLTFCAALVEAPLVVEGGVSYPSSMCEEQSKKFHSRPFTVTLTGAGVAAVIAVVVPLIRGEPTAEKVASRSDQENQRLFRNQRKMHERITLAEAKLELFEKICVKALQPRAVPALTFPVTPTSKPVTRVRCRAGWVQEGTGCVKIKTALDKTTKALDAERKAKVEALLDVQRAEAKAKALKNIEQRPAAPAPLLKK